MCKAIKIYVSKGHHKIIFYFNTFFSFILIYCCLNKTITGFEYKVIHNF